MTGRKLSQEDSATWKQILTIARRSIGLRSQCTENDRSIRCVDGVHEDVASERGIPIIVKGGRVIIGIALLIIGFSSPGNLQRAGQLGD